jgi:2-succinyl-5-enolpyruvyl-6-hydroxy-3-cyclohexene-1-carboxylate synthase
VARRLVAAMPDGGTVVTSSSMPVRDVEWYAAPRDGVRVVANRGANGIDGVVSTAVGVAVASSAPTALLIGDIALLHDSNGLLGLRERSVDLTIVCVDNDGGGIFSFLPQATALERELFELLFGTPHGADLRAVAGAHSVDVLDIDGLEDALRAGPGARMVWARTDRDDNVRVHAAVNEAVRAAL